MNTIRVSIVIPCYNHGEYLIEAINSTEWKQHDFCEVIVVNDGSTDEHTLEVLKQVESDGVQVIHQKNQGPAPARNAGIHQAKGEFILLLDADNRIDPNYYLKAMEIFEENPSISVVYSNVYHFGVMEETLVELPDFSMDRILSGNFIDACAVVRKSAFEQIGGYDEKMPVFGNEDWEFWIRCLVNGLELKHIKEPLFYYRVAETSMLTMANEKENRKKLVTYLLDKYKATYSENARNVILYYLDFLIHNEEKVLTEQETSEIFKERIQLSDQHITNIEEALESKRQDCKDLEVQNEKALESIWKLQTRINRIESSKPYKLYKHLNHFRNRFRSNNSKGSGSNFFKKMIFAFGRKGRALMKKFLSKIFKHLYLWSEEKQVYIVESNDQMQSAFSDPYHRWLHQNLPTESKLIQYRKEIDRFEKRPKFSIVIPVYNPKQTHFRAALDSILHQVYENWEVCLADDCSSDPEVKKCIEEYMKRDPRIKAVFRKENGHISAASNSGLEITTGDYIVLMDQDDLITADALYQNAKVINEHETVDLIYSDEDKIDDNGVHSYPHFKPDWSPDNLLSRNYLGHLTVFDAAIMKRIGGWREGFEGSQDYDLVLRFTEETEAIYHIPMVLYHWRIHETSAAAGEDAKPYAYIAAKKALSEALKRRNEPGTVDFLDGFRGYSIRYDLKEKEKLVSIVIPTKDRTDILTQCIKSIFEKSTYSNFEVIVVDNNSEEKEFFQYMDECQRKYTDRFKCIRAEIPFNFSSLVNRGVDASSGDYVLLLNNDTEVISPDWIEGMVEQAQRPSIGVVGVKLLYPNETIQHAGVVMGLGGAAGHVLVGEDRTGPGYFNYVNMLNNYSAVTAACIMIRRDVWDEVNGFDELFTVEYNDVDFCLKVRETGRNNIYVPHVELFHYESISRGHPHMTKESYDRHVREIQLLKDKWMDYIDNDPCYNPNLTLGAHDFSLRI